MRLAFERGAVGAPTLWGRGDSFHIRGLRLWSFHPYAQIFTMLGTSAFVGRSPYWVTSEAPGTPFYELERADNWGLPWQPMLRSL